MAVRQSSLVARDAIVGPRRGVVCVAMGRLRRDSVLDEVSLYRKFSDLPGYAGRIRIVPTSVPSCELRHEIIV